ncbi:MAG: sugar phosphate isomerase/epimerase family protein [Tepidisphaeraceae bacterium]
MFKTLSPGAIGCKPADLSAAIALAKVGGFDGLEIAASQIADEIDRVGAETVERQFADARVRPAGFALPVDWRTTEANWRRDLVALPRLAQAAAAIGVERCFTWVMPCSNERTLQENIPFHVERFKPIADILAKHNIRLGLEFIGPKTLRKSQKHPFIHTLPDMLDLGRKIGPNVGILLDAFHWYTSHGTLDQLRALKPEQVVYVHVNDARRGVDVDEQIDNQRDLPSATGVIEIAGFLRALQSIGYTGPMTPEPFKQDLADLPSDEARAQVVGASMTRMFHLARLP